MTEFSSYAHGTPCWVDVTSPDLDKTIEFYEGLFGWEADQDPQPEAGGYTMFKLKGKYVAAGSPPQEEGSRRTGRRTSRATTPTTPRRRSATPAARC